MYSTIEHYKGEDDLLSIINSICAIADRMYERYEKADGLGWLAYHLYSSGKLKLKCSDDDKKLFLYEYEKYMEGMYQEGFCHFDSQLKEQYRRIKSFCSENNSRDEMIKRIKHENERRKEAEGLLEYIKSIYGSDVFNLLKKDYKNRGKRWEEDD